MRWAAAIFSLLSLTGAAWGAAGPRPETSLNSYRVQPSDDPEKWPLLYLNQPAGWLHSIGGAPKIRRLREVKSPGTGRLVLIDYEAGTAGTSVLSLIDRLAAVSFRAGQAKLVLDLPVRFARVARGRRVLDFERKLKWTADRRVLEVGPFDEISANRYTWDKDFYRAQVIVEEP